MPPKGAVTIARNPNALQGGVIPVNPATIQTSSTKSAVRLKIEVRRLPPGLTKEEFQSALGEEWKVGGGNVDWLEYRQGKVKSPGKHPEQSRAYLHLTSEPPIKAFETTFLSTIFQDAKGTYKEPAIKTLPPTTGFAPVQRVPIANPRVDGRQGTIDQDPEYMAFLESETQPIQKPASLDNAVSDKNKEKVTTTPLIEALREKKANREKAKAAKSAKRDDPKEEKVTEKSTAKKGAKSSKSEGKDSEKAEINVAKDTPKSASKTISKATPTAPAPGKEQAASPVGSPAANKRRERAAPTIKSMLQRDLGIGQTPRRTPKQDTPVTNGANTPTLAETEAKTTSGHPGNGPSTQTPSSVPTSANGGLVKSATTNVVPPKGPRGKSSAATNPPVATTPVQAQAGTAQASVSKAPRAASLPSPGARKAYLKHANASQGITEPLIQAALAVFGEVSSVEIDKRKGTALAEFKDHESLKAAMAKRNVPVAQGAIEILEYKEKPSPPRGAAPSARGGSMRGRGRGGAARGGAEAATAATTPVTPAAPTAKEPT